MKLRVPGIPTIFRWRSLTIFVIIILLVVFGVYWFHFRANTNNKQVDASPGRAATIQPEVKDADTALNKKDYQAAANSYLAAASDALASNQPDNAVSILRQATTRIPTQNIPWYIYGALSQAARKTGDSALEKQSLEQAIQKASLPGTDVSAEQIKGFQDRLKAIK